MQLLWRPEWFMAFFLKGAIITLSGSGAAVLGYGAYLLATKEHTLEEKLLINGMRLLSFDVESENADKELWKKKITDYVEEGAKNKFADLDIEKKADPSAVTDEEIKLLIDKCKRSMNDKNPEEERYEKVKDWCSVKLDS